jgi:hypothetical protein
MKSKIQLKHVKIFAVESNLSSFPSYIICAAKHINENDIRGESFLLYTSKGTKARLMAMEIVLSKNLSHSEYFSEIDEDFVIHECLNQGKLNMLDISKNKVAYDYLPAIKSVFEVDIAHLLHGNFSHENVNNKLKLIGAMTQVDELKSHIEIINNYSYAYFTPMKMPNVEQ